MHRHADTMPLDHSPRRLGAGDICPARRTSEVLRNDLRPSWPLSARAVDRRSGPMDVVSGLSDALRRLRNPGQSDARVRQDALTINGLSLRGRLDLRSASRSAVAARRLRGTWDALRQPGLSLFSDDGAIPPAYFPRLHRGYRLATRAVATIFVHLAHDHRRDTPFTLFMNQRALTLRVSL